MMEPVRVESIAAVTTSVSNYASQLVSVFHNYVCIAERPPRALERAMSSLQGIVAQLNQSQKLLSDEFESIGNDEKQRLFNDKGLQYVRLLTLESLATLAKIEPTIIKATSAQKNPKSKGRRARISPATKKDHVVNMSMKLNEPAFLESLEKLRWRYVESSFDEFMERLHYLQLHLLLVSQVVTLGTLSRDLYVFNCGRRCAANTRSSSGKVDIQSIVTYHERIDRTALLLDVAPAKDRC